MGGQRGALGGVEDSVKDERGHEGRVGGTLREGAKVSVGKQAADLLASERHLPGLLLAQKRQALGKQPGHFHSQPLDEGQGGPIELFRLLGVRGKVPVKEMEGAK